MLLREGKIKSAFLPADLPCVCFLLKVEEDSVKNGNENGNGNGNGMRVTLVMLCTNAKRQERTEESKAHNDVGEAKKDEKRSKTV